MFSLTALLFCSLAGATGMKAVSESKHGERMGVEYQVLNSGRHVLVVNDLSENGGRELQVVDLAIKGKEAVSLYAGFRCVREVGKELVYAVVSPRSAKKSGTFVPERAWSIEENRLRLEPIADPRTIECVWSAEGESGYRFPN